MTAPRMNDYIGEAIIQAKIPFFDDNILVRKYKPDQISEFLKDMQFQSALEETLVDLYGQYRLRPRYFTASDTGSKILVDAVLLSVMTLYVRNKYKYDKLFETLNLEYNPLDNVDEHEEWEETHSGEDVTTEDIGSKTSQEKIGNRADSMTIGKSTNVNTLDVSPFETDGYHSKERTTVETGSHTDSNSIGEQNNQYTEGAQKNTGKLEHGHVIHYEKHRHGNIGITSAFQLIEQARNTAAFSLYDIIAKDIMQQLCNGVLN